MNTMEAVQEMYLGKKLTCDGGITYYFIHDGKVKFQLARSETSPSTSCDIFGLRFWGQTWEYFDEVPKGYEIEIVIHTEIQKLRDEITQLKADLRKAGKI